MLAAEAAEAAEEHAAAKHAQQVYRPQAPALTSRRLPRALCKQNAHVECCHTDGACVQCLAAPLLSSPSGVGILKACKPCAGPRRARLGGRGRGAGRRGWRPGVSAATRRRRERSADAHRQEAARHRHKGRQVRLIVSQINCAASASVVQGSLSADIGSVVVPWAGGCTRTLMVFCGLFSASRHAWAMPCTAGSTPRCCTRPICYSYWAAGCCSTAPPTTRCCRCVTSRCSKQQSELSNLASLAQEALVPHYGSLSYLDPGHTSPQFSFTPYTLVVLLRSP